MKTEYKTIDGHPIVIGGEYATREGLRVIVFRIRRAVAHFILLDRDDSIGQVYLDKQYRGYSNDLMRPCNFSELKIGENGVVVSPKKTYKLSEMWKGWIYDSFTTAGIKYELYKETSFFHTKEAVLKACEEAGQHELMAITRADATEFYEGEGLDA